MPTQRVPRRFRASAALAAGFMAAVLLGAGPSRARPFSPKDLVMLDRVSDPRISPDGTRVAYQVRETDYAANRGVTGIWLADLPGTTAPVLAPRRLTAAGGSNSSPRWSPDGRMLYFLSSRSGSSQVWRFDLAGGDAQPVTRAPLDIGSFMLSPDGQRLVVSMEVFIDCAAPAPQCTRRRLDERAAQKNTGQLFQRIFVRHWDTWSNGTRSQLFAYALDADGIATGAPVWLTRGLDGDVPSKPEGDDSEYTITPDGSSLIFSMRVAAGSSEPLSTNFDLYQVRLDGTGGLRNLTADNPAWDTGPVVSPDGRTLAYLATRRPGFESDRFGIMLKDLATGATRELLPRWDRSASGLQWSADGRTLYATADEAGQHRLFAADVAAERITALTGQGTVGSYTAGSRALVFTLENLASPAQVYVLPAAGGTPRQVTHLNEQRLAGVEFGAYEQFVFKGWNGDPVQGYLVRPADFRPGRRYPVVLIIHGGPQSAFGNLFHYRWNAETYAGAGFAVVMIDFHGTPGYGQAFTDSISGHWGDRPLEDLRKGWKYALEHYRFLDGTRACALGASYGGYMVNWIAGNWQDNGAGPWRCLVTHDGVFDARMMYYATDELWFEEWENRGTPFANPANYERFNPVDHVGEWRIPMLIVHGGQDFRIPLEQGLGAFTALQRRGIPSEFLYFPDENHWVMKPQNSMQWHDVVFGWLKRWTQ
ncbi:MAG TPA: S9 family peptidase [Steroidobacteraceae bacterium]|nr:S9 family peptidase [Steroidobacteraceae bacterium]